MGILSLPIGCDVSLRHNIWETFEDLFVRRMAFCLKLARFAITCQKRTWTAREGGTTGLQTPALKVGVIPSMLCSPEGQKLQQTFME